MSLLSTDARVRVVSQLVEGSSIASTCRLTDVSKPTVLSLLLRVGEGCSRLHNRLVRDLTCVLVQVDEIWSYIQKKQARVTERDPVERGDAYTFVGMATGSKLIISYHVGKRDQEHTDIFVTDLRARLLVAPQLSTDGFQPYVTAVNESFGGAVDYAMVHKNYSRSPRRVRDDHRYEPPRDPFITKRVVFGAPDPKHISTSHIERQNMTMRMSIRRFTRLCNGFSRKLANHRAAVALHFAFYNLCRIHESLRVTPAMEAGLTDHVWTIEELVTVALAEAPGSTPEAQPLRLRADAGPARALPGGKGWLRLVSTGNGSAPPSPAPGPTPAAPSAGPPRLTEVPREPGQLSLFPEDP
jgi:IS1 family transposase